MGGGDAVIGDARWVRGAHLEQPPLNFDQVLPPHGHNASLRRGVAAPRASGRTLHVAPESDDRKSGRERSPVSADWPDRDWTFGLGGTNGGARRRRSR
jgi:hypothetical protein